MVTAVSESPSAAAVCSSANPPPVAFKGPDMCPTNHNQRTSFLVFYAAPRRINSGSAYFISLRFLGSVLNEHTVINLPATHTGGQLENLEVLSPQSGIVTASCLCGCIPITFLHFYVNVLLHSYSHSPLYSVGLFFD